MTHEQLREEQARLRGESAPTNGETIYPIPPELREGANVDPATRAKILDAYTAACNTLPAVQWSPRQRELVREQIKNVTPR